MVGLGLTAKMLGKFEISNYSRIEHGFLKFLEKKNPPFHVRFRSLLILAAFGGLYQPSLDKIITSKPKQWGLWCYTTITFIFLASFPILNLIHFLFFEQRLYDVIMNLMIMSSGLHAIARVAWFVMRKNEFCQLYELWDDYFGGDADAAEREVSNLGISLKIFN